MLDNQLNSKIDRNNNKYYDLYCDRRHALYVGGNMYRFANSQDTR